MIFHMVALSLPVEGFYLPLHKHGSEQICKWTAQDRDDYVRVVTQIESLYAAGPETALVGRDDLEALYDPSLSPQDAARRVLPYYITCFSSNKKRIKYPHKTRNDVVVIDHAGRQDEESGLRLAVLGKGCAKLQLQSWVFEEVSIVRGTQFTEEESQTLEGRSDRTLVQVVAQATKPVTTEGTAKVVAIPAEANVRLTRTHRGEFISEIPRVWS